MPVYWSLSQNTDIVNPNRGLKGQSPPTLSPFPLGTTFSCKLWLFKEINNNPRSLGAWSKEGNFPSPCATLRIRRPFPLFCLFSLLLLASSFPGGSNGEEFACNVGDPGLIPGFRRSPREWLPTPAFLNGESMDRGAWQATVYGVAKSRTGLSD